MELAPAEVSPARPMAVIYLRVSTKDQAGRGGEAEGFSIPAQRDACLRKAEAMGLNVVEEFVDAGESARSADRPALRRMLDFVAAHRVGFVIVHKVDRLARNRADDVEITLKFKAAGSQLVSVSENIDETPSGMLLHGIMSSIAEFYSRNLATETKKGQLQKVKNGGTPGMAPFGYINTRERTPEGREIRTVAVDPDRAPWVTWLYERYATGHYSAAMLRDELEQFGVTSLRRPNKPSAPLSLSQVHSILQNRYYVGVVRFDGIEYPGKHPALISESLFADVQRVRSGRVQSKEKPRVHNHYLKGSVYCGECGEPLTFEQSRNRQGVLYDYFYCLGRQRLKNGCSFRAIQAYLLEELVQGHWSTIRLSEERVDDIRRVVTEHIAKVLPKEASERVAAQDRLAELKVQQKRLFDAIYANVLDMGEVKDEQSRLATERAAAEQVLTQHSATASHLDRALGYACALLLDAETVYGSADDTVRRDLNQGVFAHIYINDDEVVGSDFTPAYKRLLSESLKWDLEVDRKAGQGQLVRTSDLYLAPGVSELTTREGSDHPRDLPARSRRPTPTDRFSAFLGVERPRGRLPWERKNPGPLKVRGSNESILVAGAGFEPATSGL